MSAPSPEGEQLCKTCGQSEKMWQHEGCPLPTCSMHHPFEPTGAGQAEAPACPNCGHKESLYAELREVTAERDRLRAIAQHVADWWTLDINDYDAIYDDRQRHARDGTRPLDELVAALRPPATESKEVD